MANKIELYIADNDAMYLEKLQMYLLGRKKMFQLHAYSDASSLEKALGEENIRIDIIAVSESMNIPAVKNAEAFVKIMLTDSDDDDVADGYAAVCKYQKTDIIVTKFLNIYEKKTGRAHEKNKGQEAAKIVGVYSPLGSCGKTTLALLLAKAFVKASGKSFYLNMERISSFKKSGDSRQSSLSNVLLAMQTRGADVEKQIEANTILDDASGISLFASPESTLEWNEVDTESRKKLLQSLVNMKRYDAIIVDFDSELNSEKLELLACCDRILVPSETDEYSARKMKAFKNELELHSADLSYLVSRIIYLSNKSDKSEINCIQYDAAYESAEKCLGSSRIPVILQRLAQDWLKG